MPWYFRKGGIIMSLCTVGPFALPLVWFRPKTSLVWKITVTVITLVLTYLAVLLIIYSINLIKENLKIITGGFFQE